MLRSLISKFANWSIKEEYNIGFIDNTLEDIVSGQTLTYKWMQHSFKDSWFADPFVLDVTQTHIFLLVEDFYYPIGRGRISLLKVNKKNSTCEERIPLLTLNTHLSFPAILRKGTDVYVYPESGESGQLKLYKYEDYQLKEVLTLAELSLSDAVFTDLYGANYCFTTRPSIPEEETRVQYVYKLDENFSFRNQVFQYCFADKIARNAGDFFRLGSFIYRPVQDCSINYGGGVIVQAVEQDKAGEFKFTEVRRLNTSHKNLRLGVHTLNSYKGITVIDAHGYCYPILARIGNFLKSKFGL